MWELHRASPRATQPRCPPTRSPYSSGRSWMGSAWDLAHDQWGILVLCGVGIPWVPASWHAGSSAQRSQEPGVVPCWRSCSSLPLSSWRHPWCSGNGLAHQRLRGQVDRAWLSSWDFLGPKSTQHLRHRESREALKIHDKKKYRYDLRNTHYWIFAAEETINQSNDP